MKQKITHNPSFYTRLGEKSGISALVDDIVVARMNNPVVRYRFQPDRDQTENLKCKQGIHR
ncbi:hypothetical protein ACFS7Z_16490 [Pontibacter toksunensis]|uniref:Uncharacterized protein n=1 Tax=Pontibacter toksunensis TaxID=1332631 RepID=A0ABW6BYI5_9BACT